MPRINVEKHASIWPTVTKRCVLAGASCCQTGKKALLGPCRAGLSYFWAHKYRGGWRQYGRTLFDIYICRLILLFCNEGYLRCHCWWAWVCSKCRRHCILPYTIPDAAVTLRQGHKTDTNILVLHFLHNRWIGYLKHTCSPHNLIRNAMDYICFYSMLFNGCLTHRHRILHKSLPFRAALLTPGCYVR